MFSRAPSVASAFEQRREEINQLLVLRGFGAQSLGIFSRQPLITDDQHSIVRLRDTLEELGPLFASFGLYLSSRPDLLRLADCLTLAAIADRSSPTPPEQIRAILHAELSNNTDDVAAPRHFVTFDPEPFESRLLFQLHYGELANGDLIVVKIVHHRPQLDNDLKLLPSLRDAVCKWIVDPDQFIPLVEDFRSAFIDSVDCRRVAESLEMLSHDIRETDKLKVPKVYKDLCSQTILVTERLAGIRLDDYLARLRDRSQDSTASSTVDGIVAYELARQLCDIWLRQAFDGTMLPADVKPENILIRSPTEIAILDATFVTLPRGSKGNLLNYFVANATDEPSKSLVSLLKELDGGDSRISDATLDRQFRQVVAFRDGGWEDGGRANCLSDTLFAQWRLAAQRGYRPLRHLTHVYRGTFHVANLARQLAPNRDSLLEGVKDLRLTKLLHDISTMMQPSYWGGQADRVATLMMLGPRHLDEALKKVAAEEKSTSERHTLNLSSSWNSLLAILLALTSLLLFRDKLEVAISSAWSEPISCLLFMVVGALLIRLLIISSDSSTSQ